MKRIKELYHNYITGNCDDADKEKIAAELQRLNIEEDGVEELAQYDGEIDVDLSNRLMANIEYETVERHRRRKRRILKVAGGITTLIMIFGFIHLFQGETIIPKTDTFLENKVTIFNRADTVSILKLPDNSMVQLFPKSSISYKKAFEGSRRNIHLRGTAIFKVSKDPSRPFNVYSGQLITTAIGTKFKVSEYSHSILIKLLEGKIVVKKNTPAADSHYLLAGNAINYNIDNGLFTAILNTAKAKVAAKAPSKLSAEKQVIKNTRLSLNNVPMSEALDKIAAQYDVEIEYSPTDVEDINIIATLNRNQPVQKILDNIAMMNRLKIWKLDDREYIIEKKK